MSVHDEVTDLDASTLVGWLVKLGTLLYTYLD